MQDGFGWISSTEYQRVPVAYTINSNSMSTWEERGKTAMSLQPTWARIRPCLKNNKTSEYIWNTDREELGLDWEENKTKILR